MSNCKLILEDKFKSEDTEMKKLAIRKYFIKQIENNRKYGDIFINIDKNHTGNIEFKS